MKRRCIVKSLYSKLTPYVQMTGWVVILFGILALADKATAFDGRLTTMEAAFNRIIVVEEKLDLVIQLLRNKR